MKFIFTVISLIILLLFSGCNSKKEQEIVLSDMSEEERLNYMFSPEVEAKMKTIADDDERVVDEVIKLMETRPRESIGVATMNVKQTRLIENIYQLKRNENQKIRAYERFWQEEKDGLNEFFIKNLARLKMSKKLLSLQNTIRA